MSSGRTYFVAARISTAGPARSRISARFKRMRAGSRSVTGSTIMRGRGGREAEQRPDSRDPHQSGLAPRPLPVAAVRVEELGIAARAEVSRFDLSDARAGEEASRDGREVEHPAVRHTVEVVELPQPPVPHLVATRPDSRSHRGGGRLDGLLSFRDDPGG